MVGLYGMTALRKNIHTSTPANLGSLGLRLWLPHAATQTLKTLLFPRAAWALSQMRREVGYIMETSGDVICLPT